MNELRKLDGRMHNDNNHNMGYAWDGMENDYKEGFNQRDYWIYMMDDCRGQSTFPSAPAAL
jgi:hypothetical protein